MFCISIKDGIFKLFYQYKLNTHTPNPPHPCTYNADVAKLVGGGHGVIVKETGCRHPAGICVVSKDDKLVLVSSITNPEQTLLDVGHDNTLANGMDASHQVGHMLERRKEEIQVVTLTLKTPHMYTVQESSSFALGKYVALFYKLPDVQQWQS